MEERNRHIDRLRIVAMILIVFHHYGVHSDWSMIPSGTFERDFLNYINPFGKVGVSLFILISGYFVSKTQFTFKKIFKLTNHTRLVVLLVCSYFVMGQGYKLDYLSGWSNLMPTLFQMYWFVTYYVILQLFLPLIQSWVQQTARRQQLKVVLTIISIIFLPRIIGIAVRVPNAYVPNEAITFIVLTLTGHILYLYRKELKRYAGIWLIPFAISLYFMYQYPSFIENYQWPFDNANDFYFSLTGMASLNMIVFSVSLFILFISLPDWPMLLPWVPQTMFDVYLIHEHPWSRAIIWRDWIRNEQYLGDRQAFVFHSILDPLLVFVICSLIAGSIFWAEIIFRKCWRKLFSKQKPI